MARIRSIKPEFPQSESMGRISRDARLCFIMLWSIADDEGRARASSRMLASLLFPYDDDAPTLVEGWLAALEQEGCIIRYQVDGSTYLQIEKWLDHQKIDHPTPSRLPSPREGSRMLARDSESLAPDLGPRIKDLGSSSLRSDERAREPAKRGSRLSEGWGPTEELREWATTELHAEPNEIAWETDKFRDYWHARAGPQGVKLDWDGTWRNWMRKASEGKQNGAGHGNQEGRRRGSGHEAFIAAARSLLGEEQR